MKLQNVDFGRPSDTFYWGPSRALPQYMADFVLAFAQTYAQFQTDSRLPDPPDTVVLFRGGKNVWLINQAAWDRFVQATFTFYVKTRDVDRDYQAWQALNHKLHQAHRTGNLKAAANLLVEAQQATIFPELSLYGGSAIMHQALDRFPDRLRQELWGAYASPLSPPFSMTLDAELASNRDPKLMATRYPWIVNGYFGLGKAPERYFIDRMKIIDDHESRLDAPPIRPADVDGSALSTDEISRLRLISRLATFMDERKQWMMQTRSLVAKLGNKLTGPQHGWLWQNGSPQDLSEAEVNQIWERYLEYKSAEVLLRGMVASNQGQHYLKGTAFVTNTPTAHPPAGSILVVPATSPTYVPLMRQVKALVTDHGGVMSHAAIIAREFGLPCIVGTNEATKRIQTGDNIVLDLVKGEVTI